MQVNCRCKPATTNQVVGRVQFPPELMNILPRRFFAPALLLAPTFAHAISLTNTLYEGFNYTTTDNPADNTTDGDIGGNTGGTGWGSPPSIWTDAASTTLNIVSPGLLY